MANAILAQVQSACLDESRESTPAPSAISYQCMQDREEEERVPLLYQIQSHRIVAWFRWWHDSKSTAVRIPEEILGIAWELPEGSSREEESSPGTHQKSLWPRARTSVVSAK